MAFSELALGGRTEGGRLPEQSPTVANPGTLGSLETFWGHLGNLSGRFGEYLGFSRSSLLWPSGVTLGPSMGRSAG